MKGLMLMLGIALLPAGAALGIDFGWAPLPDGEYEAIVQIEPDVLAVLQMPGQKQEITSSVPRRLWHANRLRITAGTGPVRREGLSRTRNDSDESQLEEERLIYLDKPAMDALKQGRDVIYTVPATAPGVRKYRIIVGEPPKTPADRTRTPSNADTGSPREDFGRGSRTSGDNRPSVGRPGGDSVDIPPRRTAPELRPPIGGANDRILPGPDRRNPQYGDADVPDDEFFDPPPRFSNSDSGFEGNGYDRGRFDDGRFGSSVLPRYNPNDPPPRGPSYPSQRNADGRFFADDWDDPRFNRRPWPGDYDPRDYDPRDRDMYRRPDERYPPGYASDNARGFPPAGEGRYAPPRRAEAYGRDRGYEPTAGAVGRAGGLSPRSGRPSAPDPATETAGSSVATKSTDTSLQQKSADKQSGPAPPLGENQDSQRIAPTAVDSAGSHFWPLTLSLLGMFAALGGVVFLGWMNWHFRRQYQVLLARFRRRNHALAT